MKENKTIESIRKENFNNDKILTDMRVIMLLVVISLNMKVMEIWTKRYQLKNILKRLDHV